MEYVFTGTICKLAVFSNSCVVELDKPVEDMKYAIINLETKGRLKLMTDNKFMEGIKIRGEGVLGPDALRATIVEMINV